MFLVNIEVSIVGTSLISITDDLGGFRHMSWVVTGYLITYTSEHLLLDGCLMSNVLHRHAYHLGEAERHIWPKAGDDPRYARVRGFFRRLRSSQDNDTAASFHSTAFVVSSKLISRSIINRVFQGIGAAGCVSMALVVAYEMVPQDQYPGIAAQIAGAIALGSLFGPLIGGGVSGSSTWRWIFLLK
jgi:hypothetical protein